MADDLGALLDRLEAAAAAATPGPWQVDDNVTVEIRGADGESVRDRGGFRDDDAALIVAAVNALPTLIAELRAHQAAVQAVRELADRHEDDASAFDSLMGGYRDTGLDEDARRCEERAEQYRDAADRIRAAVAALDPKGQTDALA